MTSDQFLELCGAGAPMVESATHIPESTPDAVATAVTVRARRSNQSTIDRKDGIKTQVVRMIEIVFLSTVDATYGGVVSPSLGDTWNLPAVYGASNVAWKAGAPRGEYGVWTVILTRTEDQEVGGNRRGA